MKDHNGKTWVLGHRGSPALAPENTLASFEAALRGGADGVEFDLQLTRDGVLVVNHDADVDGRPIHELSVDGFRALAPGSPTFAETLRFFEAWPQARLNIELKPSALRSDGREAALAEALSGWSGLSQGRTWISSFDPHALCRLSRTRVDVPLALLATDDVHLDLLPCLPVSAVHPHYTLVTEARLATWRSEGLSVHAWTVNDSELAARFLLLGVDGLIGDDPADLVRVRDAPSSVG